MWYQSFKFYDRHSPATPDDITAFRTPLPEAERANALNYLESYAAQLSATFHDCFLISNEVSFSPGFLKPAGEEIGLAFIRRILDNSNRLDVHGTK